MSVRRDAFQRIGRPESGRGAGFTLIELLVVIAIIAILAAILFPVFARARENARKSTCQSNLKQIGLAFMQYAQDFDEMLPWCCAPASRTNAPNLTEKPHWRPENVATTDVRYNGLLEPYRRTWRRPTCATTACSSRT